MNESRETVQKTVRNVFLTTGARAFYVVVQLLVQILLARTLGSAGYGGLALCRTVLEVVSTLAKRGSENAVIRWMPARRRDSSPEACERLVGVVARRILVTALLSSVALFLAAGWVANTLFQAHWLMMPLQIVALILPFYCMMGMLRATLFSVNRLVRATVLVNVVFSILMGIGAISLASLGYGLSGAMVGIGLAVIGCVLLLLRELHSTMKVGAICNAFRKHTDGDVAQYSNIMLGVSLGGMLGAHLDRIILGVMLSPAEVGLYQAAAILASQTAFIRMASNTALSPAIAELHETGARSRLEETLKRVTCLEFVAVCPLLLVLFGFPYDVLGLFGDEFDESASILLVLLGGQLVNVTSGGVGAVLNMTGHHRTELVNTWAGLAVLTVLALALIPLYGATGAAVGAAASVSLINLARVGQVWRRFGLVPFSGALLRALILLVICAFSSRFIIRALPQLGSMWIIVAILTTTLFLSSAWFLVLERRDRDHIYERLRRLRSWQR